MKNTKAIIQTLKLDDNALDQAVKIQGTPYDRKRKVTPDMVRKMQRLLKKKGLAEVAAEFGLSAKTVRYNTDPEYRVRYIASLSGAHTGKDRVSKKNRVSYKRDLVANGLLAV